MSADGGYCHTLALSDSGSIYSLGCGEDGQRGAPEVVKIDGSVHSDVVLPSFTEIALPSKRKALTIASGLNHSLAIDEAGDVWAWGSNEYGQLGLPGDSSYGLPTKVPGIPCPATSVSAGSTHSAILGKDGHVYTMGNSDNGQLGTGSSEGWPTKGTNPNALGHWK